MLRKTNYGVLTNDESLNDNEKAVLYIKECAESVGIKVVEGETAFSIPFVAEIMRRLREGARIALDTVSEIIDYENDKTVDWRDVTDDIIRDILIEHGWKGDER